MEISKRARRFGIASGIVAILVGSPPIVGLMIAFVTLSRYWVEGFLILFGFIIYPMVTMVTMGLCAFYFLSLYGKQKSMLLGISAALLAAARIFSSLGSALFIMRSLRFDFVYTFILFTEILYAAIFTIMAVTYFSKKPSVNIKIFPIIAIVVAAITPFIIHIIRGNFNFSIWSLIADWIYIAPLIPFLLFSLFCPIANMNSINNTSLLRSDEQKDIIEQENTE